MEFSEYFIKSYFSSQNYKENIELSLHIKHMVVH